MSFTFAAENQDEFIKWLNKLQLSASKVDVEGLEGQISGFTPPYTHRTLNVFHSDESLTNSNKIYPVGYSESEDSDFESDKTSTSASLIRTNTPTPKMIAAEPILSISRTSEELTDASMDAIKRIIEIERLLRVI